MSCLICKSNDEIILFEGINSDKPNGQEIPIKKCLNCSTVCSDYSNMETVDNLYFENYYGENSSKSLINNIFIKLFQIERRVKSLGKRRSGKILDIGCGDGTFLRNVSGNWIKYGYEPSEQGQKALKQISEIILYDIFGDLNLKSNDHKFDVITLWHSFEHIQNPEETLKLLRNLLKKNGDLFISVPNFESIQSKLFGKYWFHLDPARHCIHYTPTTLVRLLEANGFRINYLNTFSFEYNLFSIWQSILNFTGFKFNLAYKMLKFKQSRKQLAVSKLEVILLLFFMIPALILACFISIIELLSSKGGVVEIRAQNK